MGDRALSWILLEKTHTECTKIQYTDGMVDTTPSETLFTTVCREESMIDSTFVVIEIACGQSYQHESEPQPYPHPFTTN